MLTGIEGLAEWLMNEKKRLLELCQKHATALEQARGGLHEIEQALKQMGDNGNGEADDKPGVPAGGG